MIGWVAQNLTKVLPQPDEKYKETNDIDNDEHTEVRHKSVNQTTTPQLPHNTSLNSLAKKIFVRKPEQMDK